MLLQSNPALLDERSCSEFIAAARNVLSSYSAENEEGPNNLRGTIKELQGLKKAQLALDCDESKASELCSLAKDSIRVQCLELFLIVLYRTAASIETSDEVKGVESVQCFFYNAQFVQTMVKVRNSALNTMGGPE